MTKYIISLILVVTVITILYVTNFKETKIIKIYGQETITEINKYLETDNIIKIFEIEKLNTIYLNCINDQKTYFDSKLCNEIKKSINIINNKENINIKYGKLKKQILKIEKQIN